MRLNEQGRAAQVVAWAWVAAVHVGLFWLLGLHERSVDNRPDGMRMRLVFIEQNARSPIPTLPSLPAPRPGLRTLPARPDRAVAAESRTPQESKPEAVPTISAAELLEQGSAWARQQTTAPSFTNDPLRNRRAQLPGGDRPGSFRMRDPLTPARVVGFIGMAFGDPGPPCPRIRGKLSGLLTATSDRERELLEEELRRDRDYCRP